MVLFTFAMLSLNAPAAVVLAQSVEPAIFASVLPSSRSVAVGARATFFATIINSGTSDAIGCFIAPGTGVDATFFYQETDPATNSTVGVVNTPVDILAGRFQTFLFAYEPISAFAPTELEQVFDCENTTAAPVTTGLNTVLLGASDEAPPDVVALAATPSADGVVTASPAGAFSVASVNVGVGADMTVSVDTGSVSQPLSLSLCQTDPVTGAGENTTAPSSGPIFVTINAGATPTFAIFVNRTADIAFDPGANRIFVRFKDTAGATRGATSVAVRTLGSQPAPEPPPPPVDGEIIHGPSGDINTPEGGTIGSVTAPLSAQQFADQFSAPIGRSAAPPNTIAYLLPSENGPNLRLIDGDGANDRSVTTLPNTTRYVGDLSWRPDGTEISFASDFEVGVWSSDLYAVTIDGSNLRRLTNVPRPIAYPNYPQGKAQLTVLYPEPFGGVSLGYIEGAQQAYGWLAHAEERRVIEYTVADFGDGLSQSSVLRAVGCYFDRAANLDVVAGTTKVIPQHLPPNIFELDDGCPLNLSPQWLDNDEILFMKRRGGSNQRALDLQFSLTRAPVEALSPQSVGNEFATYTEDFNVVEGENSEILSVRINPIRSSEEFMLLSQMGPGVTWDSDKVFVGTFTDPAQPRLHRPVICPDEPGCDLGDAEFLPDGRSFVYSTLVTEVLFDPYKSKLRLFSNEDGTVKHETLIEIPSGNLGRLAVSPDGRRILVERTGDELDAVTQLWLYDRDTGDFSEFLANGHDPAWR